MHYPLPASDLVGISAKKALKLQFKNTQKQIEMLEYPFIQCIRSMRKETI